MNAFFFKTGLLPHIFSIVIVLAAMVSCGGDAAYRTSEGAVWNTTFHIKYRGDRQLDDSIHAVMKRVEMSLSPFNPSSLVSRINRGEDVTVDPDFALVFALSKRVNSLSHGAFDPTAAPLFNLWGFGYDNSGSEPTAAMVDSALSRVGMAHCDIIGGKVVKKSPGTTFSFSAVAKGYGCDEVAAMLRRNGCRDYMVEIGGEITVAGVNARGEKWNIMIDAPVYATDGSHTGMAVIEVTDCGVATSGNYRNYRDTASGRIGHTINPVSGYPSGNATVSATIIAPTCAMADAMATACMVLEPSAAMDMVENAEGVECLLVVSGDTGMEIVTSAGFPPV